jgi:hypothetical protein
MIIASKVVGSLDSRSVLGLALTVIKESAKSRHHPQFYPFSPIPNPKSVKN